MATCTDSMQPVLFADWLQPGMHCTNLGPAEWEEGVYGRGDVVVRQGTGGIDLPESEHVLRLRGHSPVAYVAGTEAERARIPQIAHGPSMFTRAAPSIVDVMTGRCAGRRRHEDITLYINVGNQGLQFAAVGQVAYQEAMARGLGRTIPTEWFLQHIRD